MGRVQQVSASSDGASECRHWSKGQGLALLLKAEDVPSTLNVPGMAAERTGMRLQRDLVGKRGKQRLFPGISSHRLITMGEYDIRDSRAR